MLGRQRDGFARLGSATDAAPLLGGLRIGKADPEGTPDGDGECPATFLCNVDMAIQCGSTRVLLVQVVVPCTIEPCQLNAGQYMHYLTKWAFALNRMAVVTHEAHYNDLAIQLIKGGFESNHSRAALHMSAMCAWDCAC